jgi:ADP-ribosylglycohydrolase
MFFCRNPRSAESLFDVVSSGGDTDTNGSMIGAMLGALHGTAIFPPHLVDGLLDREAVIEIANKFFDTFGGA